MDVQNYVERARHAMKDGEFDLSERYFAQVLEINPENRDALNGLKELEVARIQSSGSVLTILVKWGWAIVLNVCGKQEQAYPHLKLLSRLKVNSLSIHNSLARCAEKLGRLEEAHDSYSRVLELNATHETTLRADAELLVKLDRYDEASDRLKKLVILRPDDDKVEHRLRDVSAQAYARVGVPKNLMERRAAIEKKKLEAPGNPEFMDKLENMLSDYKADQSNHSLGIQIAAHYRLGKLYDDANRILSSMLDKDPQFTPARLEQANVWRKSGDLKLSANLYEELLIESPHDQELKDHCFESKIALLSEQTTDSSGDTKTILNQIEKLKLEKNTNRISWIKKIILDRPDAFQERVELGGLLLERGQIDEAVPLLQRLVHEPSWADQGYFLLGQCFRSQGDNQLAVQQFEKSLKFHKNKGYSHVPTDDLKSVYYYMGLALEALGKMEKAREAYGFVYSADITFKDIRKRYEQAHRV